VHSDGPRKVLPLTRREVVEYRNRAPLRKEPIGDVRSDEAGAPGDENIFHDEFVFPCNWNRMNLAIRIVAL
jgi:hypothetical protein